MIVTHYLNGGWYPVGGSSAIAKTMVPLIEEVGGMVLTQRRVRKILLESGIAVGVTAENIGAKAGTETYYAPVVISDVGAFNHAFSQISLDWHWSI